MQKDGHKNGNEYKAMHAALLRASKLDPSKDSISSVEKALDDIDSTSREYQRTHTGMFKATKGYGADRLQLSKDNQKLAAQKKDILKKMSNGLGKYNVISGMRSNKEAGLSGQAESGKVRGVKLSELEDVEGKKIKTGARKRRNTVADSKKTMEINPLRK